MVGVLVIVIDEKVMVNRVGVSLKVMLVYVERGVVGSCGCEVKELLNDGLLRLMWSSCLEMTLEFKKLSFPVLACTNCPFFHYPHTKASWVLTNPFPLLSPF